MRKPFLQAGLLFCITGNCFSQPKLTIIDSTSQPSDRVDLSKPFYYRAYTRWHRGLVTGFDKDSVHLVYRTIALTDFRKLSGNNLSHKANLFFAGAAVTPVGATIAVITEGVSIPVNGVKKESKYPVTRILAGTTIGLFATGIILKMVAKNNTVRLGRQFTLVIK